MKVITKKIKSKNFDFSKYFNQMLGLEDIPAEYIYNKYESMFSSCENFVKIWEMISETEIFQKFIKPNFMVGTNQIYQFLTDSRKELASLKVFPVEKKPEKNIKSVDELLLKFSQKYDEKELNLAYKNLKKSKTLEYLIVSYEKIKSLLSKADPKNPEKFLEPKNFDADFITSSDEDTQILSFTNIDFKSLYNLSPEKITEILTNTILYGFRITYMEGRNAYKEYSTPDIDVEKFCSSFISKLSELKKQIKNCNHAFSAIEKSIKLLEKNFNRYYKKFITTKNPSTIFEDFLADVANKNKNNLTIVVELKKIINEIKNLLKESKAINKDTENLINFADNLIDSFQKKEKPEKTEEIIEEKNEKSDEK